MNHKVKEAEYKGVISAEKHWLEEIAAHEGKEEPFSKAWVEYAKAQLKQVEKRNER